LSHTQEYPLPQSPLSQHTSLQVCKLSALATTHHPRQSPLLTPHLTPHPPTPHFTTTITTISTYITKGALVAHHSPLTTHQSPPHSPHTHHLTQPLFHHTENQGLSTAPLVLVIVLPAIFSIAVAGFAYYTITSKRRSLVKEITAKQQSEISRSGMTSSIFIPHLYSSL
jgi:hypothetical protein